MTGLSQARFFFLDGPGAMAGGLATNGSMCGDYSGISARWPCATAQSLNSPFSDMHLRAYLLQKIEPIRRAITGAYQVSHLALDLSR